MSELTLLHIRKDEMMKDIIKSKEKGNLVVISGPSGAGKSTIAKEIAKQLGFILHRDLQRIWKPYFPLPHS